MGMDVYGLAPATINGHYFRRSVWGWHPLAELCIALAPGLAGRCAHWHTNDGAGLDDSDARALGQCLKAALGNGRVADYVTRRDRKLAALPAQRCTTCNGTGIRHDAIGHNNGMNVRVIDEPGHPRHGETGWCNGCNGRGSERPFETHYRLSTKDAEEFAAFLLDCGGFQIC